MKRRPIATLRVLDLGHIAEGAIRVEVDCPASTTGITSIPGPRLALTREQTITAACYAHEERCDGGCDTSQAHAQGDTAIRDATERAWRLMRAAAARRYSESVRN